VVVKNKNILQVRRRGTIKEGGGRGEDEVHEKIRRVEREERERQREGKFFWLVGMIWRLVL